MLIKVNTKTIFIMLAAAVSIFFIARAVTIMLEGEEGRLKKAIYKDKKLAEEESVAGLRENISPDYSDELGNDRQSLLFIAKSFFDEYSNILIFINKLEIKIDGENGAAYVEATVYWQEGDSEDIIYDTAKVEAGFRKEQRHWKLIELKFLEPEKKKLFNPLLA